MKEVTADALVKYSHQWRGGLVVDTLDFLVPSGTRSFRADALVADHTPQFTGDALVKTTVTTSVTGDAILVMPVHFTGDALVTDEDSRVIPVATHVYPLPTRQYP